MRKADSLGCAIQACKCDLAVAPRLFRVRCCQDFCLGICVAPHCSATLDLLSEMHVVHSTYLDLHISVWPALQFQRAIALHLIPVTSVQRE